MLEDDRSDTVAHLVRLGGPRPAVSRERAARVRARVHEEWRHTVAARRRRATALAGVVALAASLLLIVSLVRDRGVVQSPVAQPPVVATVVASVGPVTLDDGRPLAVGATLREGQALRTQAGSVAALDLGNRTSLRVDENTRLQFVTASRLRLEAGAMYFDDEPGSDSSAIEVQTPSGVVRDIGTQFEVRVLDDRVRVRVRVREGEVVFTRGAAATRGKAGTEILVRGDEVTTREVAVSGSEWAWIARSRPRFDLAGKTLAEFLAWFTRETGYGVAFEGDSAARASQITLQGSIDGMSPEEALEAVVPATGFDARVVDGRVVVRQP